MHAPRPRGAGDGGPSDLAALQREVAALRGAMASAGAALTGAAGPPAAPAGAGSAASGKYRVETNAIRKATRTFVQGLIVTLPGVAVALKVDDKWIPYIPLIGLCVMPLVAYVQNKLEDLHVIPPFLRSVGTKDTVLSSAIDGVTGGIGDAFSHSGTDGPAR